VNNKPSSKSIVNSCDNRIRERERKRDIARETRILALRNKRGKWESPAPFKSTHIPLQASFIRALSPRFHSLILYKRSRKSAHNSNTFVLILTRVRVRWLRRQ